MGTSGYESIALPVNLLKLLGGIAPQNPKTRNLYLVFAITIQLFFGWGFVIPLLMNCILDFRSLDDIARSVYLFVEMSVSMVKLFFVLINSEKLFEIFDILDSKIFTTQTPYQENILRRNMTVIKRLAILYYAGATGCDIMYGFLPIFLGRRELPHGTWYPFNTQRTPVFEIVYICQFLSPFIVSTQNCSMDILIVGCLSSACTQFDILNDSLKNLYKTSLENFKKQYRSEDGISGGRKELDSVISQEIVRCVLHHRKIFQFIEIFQKIFNYVMFAQFTGSSLVLCVTIYRLSVIKISDPDAVEVVLFMNMMLSQIFLYCWYGNKLYFKSMEVSTAIWKSDWIECSPKIRKSLCFIMNRAKTPIAIAAGPFIVVQLDVFISIVKSAYSFFALLNNMKEKE